MKTGREDALAHQHNTIRWWWCLQWVLLALKRSGLLNVLPWASELDDQVHMWAIFGNILSVFTNRQKTSSLRRTNHVWSPTIHCFLVCSPLTGDVRVGGQSGGAYLGNLSMSHNRNDRSATKGICNVRCYAMPTTHIYVDSKFSRQTPATRCSIVLEAHHHVRQSFSRARSRPRLRAGARRPGVGQLPIMYRQQWRDDGWPTTVSGFRQRSVVTARSLKTMRWDSVGDLTSTLLSVQLPSDSQCVGLRLTLTDTECYQGRAGPGRPRNTTLSYIEYTPERPVHNVNVCR